jgi:hypothetical protein
MMYSLWLQKLVLLDFSRHIIQKLRWEKLALWGIGIILFGSYVAAQITTFSECDPFHLYWQVIPNPGTCSQAQVQLFVLGTYMSLGTLSFATRIVVLSANGDASQVS